MEDAVMKDTVRVSFNMPMREHIMIKTEGILCMILHMK